MDNLEQFIRNFSAAYGKPSNRDNIVVRIADAIKNDLGTGSAKAFVDDAISRDVLPDDKRDSSSVENVFDRITEMVGDPNVSQEESNKAIVDAIGKHFGISSSSSNSENSGWMDTLKDKMDSVSYEGAKKYVSDYEKKHDIKSDSKEEDDGEWIEYTYKPGDTFGQVILDQGLATNHGLWGADGDVAYYNQYLDPSKMASYGIPVGTTIRLKKRK